MNGVMGFAKLPRSSAAGDAVRAIQEMILSGRLAPGQRLPAERELSELLGISRPTLRETIRSLVSLNILESRHGAGTFVASLDTSTLLAPLQFVMALNTRTVDELFEARLLLEPALAAMAASRATDDHVAALRELTSTPGDDDAGNTAPAKNRSTKTKPAKTGLAKTDAADTETDSTPAAMTGPGKTDPFKTEPDTTGLGKVEADKVERTAAESGKAAAGKTEQTEAGFRESGPDGDPVARDLQLHRLVADAAGNALLSTMLESLAALGRSSREVTSVAPGVLARSAEEHVAIVDAIARRDPDAARAAMATHLSRIADIAHDRLA